MIKQNKIVIPGGAGLVGQNLVHLLVEKGFSNIVVIDKNQHNCAILEKMRKEILVVCADLAVSGAWEQVFQGADAVVILQAQIGGNNPDDFIRNNITATANIVKCINSNGIRRVIHVSSSVVNSGAYDLYTETKKQQESLVSQAIKSCTILRPTLMFGWFDRKHLGWLSRFMQKSPIFPVPGDGKFTRQPLYVEDFCSIIINCIYNDRYVGAYNISGLEYIDYVELISLIRKSCRSYVIVIKIPYHIFYFLLWLWALFDKNPPFTIKQLKALVYDETFEMIDWPSIFQVNSTPLSEAIDKTFSHDIYSKIKLRF